MQTYAIVTGTRVSCERWKATVATEQGTVLQLLPEDLALVAFDPVDVEYGEGDVAVVPIARLAVLD